MHVPSSATREARSDRPGRRARILATTGSRQHILSDHVGTIGLAVDTKISTLGSTEFRQGPRVHQVHRGHRILSDAGTHN
jgi:hypothetical protein